MRNKPVTAELLPNSNEVQPGLTFFGPVTNQPLNQFGQQPSEPALHEHLEPVYLKLLLHLLVEMLFLVLHQQINLLMSGNKYIYMSNNY
jgi:hypothetical protein